MKSQAAGEHPLLLDLAQFRVHEEVPADDTLLEVHQIGGELVADLQYYAFLLTSLAEAKAKVDAHTRYVAARYGATAVMSRANRESPSGVWLAFATWITMRAGGTL